MTQSTPLLVSITVWLALACYPAGLLGRTSASAWPRARWVWSLGCALFQIHAISAYALVYGWSHAVAVTETARQTATTTGFDSGVGLYLNFVFAGAWLADAILWWVKPERVRGRLTRPAVVLHLFFLFMITNGAFVFVASPMRWLGLIVTILGVYILWAGLRQRKHQKVVES